MENCSCIFCKIASNKKIVKIYEDNDVFAIFDKDQSFLGHILVIPKKHYENLLLVSKKILYKLMNIVSLIGNIEKNIFNANGIKIITNIGKSANQTIMHCHIHVIPFNIKKNQINNKKINKINKIKFNIIKEISFFIKNTIQ